MPGIIMLEEKFVFSLNQKILSVMIVDGLSKFQEFLKHYTFPFQKYSTYYFACQPLHFILSFDKEIKCHHSMNCYFDSSLSCWHLHSSLVQKTVTFQPCSDLLGPEKIGFIGHIVSNTLKPKFNSGHILHFHMDELTELN